MADTNDPTRFGEDPESGDYSSPVDYGGNGGNGCVGCIIAVIVDFIIGIFGGKGKFS